MVYLIGGSSGIGLEMGKVFASRGAHAFPVRPAPPEQRPAELGPGHPGRPQEEGEVSF
jgi:NAD(P)-dependent dehydrogenase (short-subunit alcohol dehydrogenase family)